MNKQFSEIARIIQTRRSIKPARMNGKKISDEQIRQLLELANWAPSHGRTEPWRFIVYSGEKVKEFCHQHAELYKANTSPEQYLQEKYDKQLHNGDLASHLVIAVMQRGNSPKIPVLEEIAATAASIQNILLGASAAGFAGFWSTGGITHHPAMKRFLKLREEDIIMGILYFGFSDEQLEGKRQTTLDEKLTWK